jgi:hypothetical protein
LRRTRAARHKRRPAPPTQASLSIIHCNDVNIEPFWQVSKKTPCCEATAFLSFQAGFIASIHCNDLNIEPFGKFLRRRHAAKRRSSYHFKLVSLHRRSVTQAQGYDCDDSKGMSYPNSFSHRLLKEKPAGRAEREADADAEIRSSGEAVQKAAFLKEFCYGVRIVGHDDGSVLYSSLPQTARTLRRAIRMPTRQPARVSLDAARASAASTSAGIGSPTRSRACRHDRGRSLQARDDPAAPPRDLRRNGRTGKRVDGQEYLSNTIEGMLLKETLTGFTTAVISTNPCPPRLSAAYESGHRFRSYLRTSTSSRPSTTATGTRAAISCCSMSHKLQKKVRRTDSWTRDTAGTSSSFACPRGRRLGAPHRQPSPRCRHERAVPASRTARSA